MERTKRISKTWNLMDSRPVAVDHLVELVDAADTLVCQHESSSLQSHFSRQGILHNCCSQTDSWKSKQWYICSLHSMMMMI